MTIKGSFGKDINTVLLRLNILLQNGYFIDVSKDMVYYRKSDSFDYITSEVVSLNHRFKRELNLYLYPDGLISQQKCSPLGEEGPNEIRIHEEEHEKFLKFVRELPKINLFHKIFSFYLRLR